MTENDRSVVLLLAFGSFDATFGGDLSGDTSSSVHNIEGVIAPSLGQVELYKVHHHGSATSSSTPFLNVLRPKIASLSMSATNGFGHPTASAMNRLHATEAVTYWTTAGNGVGAAPPRDVVVSGSFVVDVPAPGTTFTVNRGATSDNYSSWPPPATCNYILSPAFKRAAAAGGPGTFGINTAAECSWTVLSNAPWLTLTSASSGTGSTTVGYTVDENGIIAQRVGTLTAAGETFTVTQYPAFTDASVTPGVTLIRAVHVTELRSRIDTLRAARGLPGFVWTDPAPASGLTFVRAVHILELRTALSHAYEAAGLSPPGFSDPSLTAGSTIRAVHLTELRAALVAIE